LGIVAVISEKDRETKRGDEGGKTKKHTKRRVQER
jgi:hypothetical protein